MIAFVIACLSIIFEYIDRYRFKYGDNFGFAMVIPPINPFSKQEKRVDEEHKTTDLFTIWKRKRVMKVSKKEKTSGPK